MVIDASKKMTFLVLSLAFAMQSPGIQAEEDNKVQAIFDKMDSNGDGKVDQAEFLFEKGAVSYLIDKNSDGMLSRDEVLISDEAFAEVDGNGDGMVSYIEFVQAGLGNFENLDSNSDGFVEVNELEAWINK